MSLTPKTNKSLPDDIASGPYRCISDTEAQRLIAAGQAVAFSEDTGYVIYDDLAKEEFLKKWDVVSREVTAPDTIAAMTDYKAQAKQLRQMLASDGVTVTHSQALDRVAKLHGLRDWNVMSAQLATVSKQAPSLDAQAIGSFSVSDWRRPGELAPGDPKSIGFTALQSKFAMKITAQIGDNPSSADFCGIVLEVEAGAIRVMGYDCRISDTPTIMTISADGSVPIGMDRTDHMNNLDAIEDASEPLDDMAP